MTCPICELRAENDKLKADKEKQWLENGSSLMTDNEGPLPIRVTFNKRPTKDQWRRMIRLAREIQNNPKLSH